MVRKHSQRVSESESRIDEIERQLTARIFESSLRKGKMVHLHGCIREITRISDAIEDAADQLEWVSVKSVI